MRFLAAEKLSEHKYKTPEGYLVCVDAVLSRTGKQKYMRSELFGDECKNPTDEVEVDRLEADVFDEKAMASFENKPICIEHPDEDVNVANHNDLSVGFVRDIKRGTDNGQPVMLGTLVITDENAIDLVESGEYAELSCGYDCDIADDEHPTQRNIRGNHVALCKQGRAGIARIVDSIDDFAVMRYDFSTNIAAFERAIVNNDVAEFNAMLPTFEKDITDYNEWKAEGKLSAADVGKVKRQIDKINDLLAKSSINKRFEVKDMATLKDDEYVQLPRGRFKLVAKTKEELEKEGYGYHHSDNGYSVYVKNNSAVAIKDIARANDADYEQWTKQGWRVAALYKDGGRIHAIVERKSGDFVVALGYNTSTGEWAQGRYVSTFGAAVDTLNEEKPGAVPIRDAKLAKKTFEVSFVKDDVTYVRKVKADSLQDAIRKVKDERLSPMTYKKLKELGVSQRQWSGWTQEQASEYIRKHGETNQSTAKQKKQKTPSVEELFDKKSLEKATNIIRRMDTPYDSDVQDALDALKIDAQAWEEDRDRVSVSTDNKEDIIKAATFFKSLGYKFRISSYEDDDETSYEFVLR